MSEKLPQGGDRAPMQPHPGLEAPLEVARWLLGPKRPHHVEGFGGVHWWTQEPCRLVTGDEARLPAEPWAYNVVVGRGGFGIEVGRPDEHGPRWRVRFDPTKARDERLTGEGYDPRKWPRPFVEVIAHQIKQRMNPLSEAAEAFLHECCKRLPERWGWFPFAGVGTGRPPHDYGSDEALAYFASKGYAEALRRRVAEVLGEHEDAAELVRRLEDLRRADAVGARAELEAVAAALEYSMWEEVRRFGRAEPAAAAAPPAAAAVHVIALGQAIRGSEQLLCDGSPMTFNDGKSGRNAAAWTLARQEARAFWAVARGERTKLTRAALKKLNSAIIANRLRVDADLDAQGYLLLFRRDGAGGPAVRAKEPGER